MLQEQEEKQAGKEKYVDEQGGDDGRQEDDGRQGDFKYLKSVEEGQRWRKQSEVKII